MQQNIVYKSLSHSLHRLQNILTLVCHNVQQAIDDHLNGNIWQGQIQQESLMRLAAAVSIKPIIQTVLPTDHILHVKLLATQADATASVIHPSTAACVPATLPAKAAWRAAVAMGRWRRRRRRCGSMRSVGSRFSRGATSKRK